MHDNSQNADGKWLASVQSNYVPWRGYFEMIASVETFVVLDDVQYTRRDWRNRNRIKTENGTKWLTIPVETSGNYLQRIDETRVAPGTRWATKHWLTLKQSYGRCPFFAQYEQRFADAYAVAAELEMLADINRLFVEMVCDVLGITTQLENSSSHTLRDGKNERLLDLCIHHDANVYLSGPAASDYLDIDLFADSNVAVEWMLYEQPQMYEQPHGEFDPHVTVLDLLFCTGPDASSYLQPMRASGVLAP